MGGITIVTTNHDSNLVIGSNTMISGETKIIAQKVYVLEMTVLFHGIHR